MSLASPQPIPARPVPRPAARASALPIATHGAGVPRYLQAKLDVSQPGDAYEQEADRVAESIMRMPEPALQRSCAACAAGDAPCPSCAQKEDGLAMLKREAAPASAAHAAPAESSIGAIGAGRPLDAGTRSFFEPRFGRSFADVRVHDDAGAAASARTFGARAYAIGRDLAFGSGQYAPDTAAGRQLLAHELTHVLQQTDPASSGPDGARAHPAAVRVGAAQPMIARADTQAVGVTMNLGTIVGSGIQFAPTNVTDTRVGPTSVRGGLLSGGASRLNVIVGENLTPRTLARQLLPLWLAATPFTPPGAAAPLPLDVISEEELARALLVHNQHYLPVPAMTNWRAGLRLPLPVEIEEATGIATLHPLRVRALAGGFDPAWAPLLDARAAATAAPPAATLQADATAFLGRETDALGRGIHLGARALTNALAELPFVREVFRQLGAAGFEVALEFMNFMVNRQIDLLAAQRDGAAILAEIRSALGAAPATPSPDQQRDLDRANRMLARVVGTAAVAPPAAARNRAEKAVTIDTVKLNGSTHTPAADVAAANAILAQCNVRLNHVSDQQASAADTTTWLHGDTDLGSSPSCGSVTPDERDMFRGATTTFGLTSRIRAFFPATLSGIAATGYAMPPFCATGAAAGLRGLIVLTNPTTREDLAHEVGHFLLNSGAHPTETVMSPFGGRTAIGFTNPQCTTIYNNA